MKFENQQFIQQWVDGELSDESERRLVEVLTANPEMLEELCSYSALDTDLKHLFSEKDGLLENLSEISMEAERESAKRNWRLAGAVAIAAVLLVLLVLRSFYASTPEQGMPRYRVAMDSEISIEYPDKEMEGLQNGEIVEGTRFKLSQGTLEIELPSGVRSVIQAPADLTYHGEKLIYLNHGTAWFQVPEEGKGFQVRTRNVLVTDLGTEFGVISYEDELDEVHLLSGEVEVENLNGLKRRELLSAGEHKQARVIGAAGRLRPIDARAGEFLTELPKGLLYYHWSFDEISEGGFAANGTKGHLTGAKAVPQSVSPESLHKDGRFGMGVSFSGKSGQELVTGWAGMDERRPHTVACWVKLDPVKHVGYQPGGFVSWSLPDPDSRYSRWLIHHPYNRLRLSCSGETDATTSLRDGKWHHVAYVYRGKTDKDKIPVVRFYVDGVEDAVFKRHENVHYLYTGRSIHEPHPVGFGMGFRLRSSLDGVLNGSLDEVYIFQGELNAEQIRALMKRNQYIPNDYQLLTGKDAANFPSEGGGKK